MSPIINLIGLGLAILFIVLIGVVTILNIPNYRKENNLIKFSAFLNILSLVILLITPIIFRSKIYLVTAILLPIIWLAALFYGFAQKKINWPHHLIRATINVILLVMMLGPWS
ncbi:hypothetical protein ACFQAV_13165 [Companilactobacillus huachuanensis]|uniref:Uncharacterized protein n=1 Tax=Companilactobacillus huachuanensis TaxID=2559914 RepID=A0ABW1RQR6_9LACO|nr:hypothetical protein [Companilactobacillus huachuanensis]